MDNKYCVTSGRALPGRARVLACLSAAVLLSCGAAALGHHSYAMFEMQKMVEVKGTVKEFRYTNPHSWIVLYVENAAGTSSDFTIEARDTLIVDTIGIRDDVPLNYEGLPHSEKLRVKEKFRESTPGVLVDEITIEDPIAFVSPWKEIETYRYRPDLSIREYVCLEKNRNVGKDGEAKFDE